MAERLDPMVHLRHSRESGDISQTIELLGDADASVRAAAARSLGDLQARTGDRRLVVLLDDACLDVRMAAAIARPELAAPAGVASDATAGPSARLWRAAPDLR